MDLESFIRSNYFFIGLLAAISCVFGFIYVGMPVNPDEAVFLLIGEKISQGVSLYSQVSDIKPPGIFLISTLLSVLSDRSIVLARSTVYLFNLGTAVIIYYAFMEFEDKVTAKLSSILFLLFAYSDHLKTYYFITEPFAVFLLVSSFYFWLRRNKGLSYFVASGVIAGIGVLFKQTVGLYFIAINIVVGTRWLFRRYKDFRPFMVQMAAFNVAGLIPLIIASGYFWLSGSFQDFFFFNFKMILGGYDPPFSVMNLMIALVSLLPIWILAFSEGWRSLYCFVRFDEDFEWMIISAVSLVMLYPAFRYWGGGHRLMFALPFMVFLSAKSISSIFSDKSLGIGMLGDRTASIVMALFLVFFAVSGFQILTLNHQSIDAPPMEDNQTYYSFPFKNEVFFQGTSKPPNMYIGSVFADELVERVVTELESEQVPRVVVSKSALSGKDIRLGYPYEEERQNVFEFIQNNYVLYDETDSYLLYRRP